MIGAGVGPGFRRGGPVVLDYTLGAVIGASLEQENWSAGGSTGSNASLTSPLRATILRGNALAGCPISFPANFDRDADASGAGWRGASMAKGSTSIPIFQNIVNRVLSPSKAGHVFLAMGRNGITGLSTAEHFRIYNEMCVRMRSEGRIIHHIGLFMRTSASYTPGSAEWNMLIALDEWQRAYAATYAEGFVDCQTPMHLVGSPEPYAVDPLYLRDDVHLNDLGGELLSQAFATYFRGYFGSAWRDIGAIINNSSNNGHYDIRYLELTGGARLTNAIGFVPDNCSLVGVSDNAITIEGFAPVLRDGIPQYRMRITPSGVAGPDQTLTFRASNEFSSIGVFKEFICGRFEIEGDSSALKSYYWRTRMPSQPTVETSQFTRFDTGGPYHTTPRKLRYMGMVTQYTSVPASTQTQANLLMQVSPVGAAFDIWISELCWRTVDHLGNYPQKVVAAIDDP